MSDPISSQGTYTKFRVRTNAADNESFAGQSTRKRAIRSCITCYRAKVRCDRRHPCERYTASGAAEQCTYMDDSRPGPTPWETPSHPAKEKDLVRAPEYKMYYFTGSTTTRTGLSHWASVINELEGVGDYLFDRKPSFHHIFQRLMQLRELYPPRTNHNFPFGRPAVETSLGAFPTPFIVDSLVASYMETWNITHPLFSSNHVQKELMHYQNVENCPPSWLAQLSMVLLLGCKTASEGLFEHVGGKSKLEELAQHCLGLAETYVSRAQFLDFPDLSMIRTFCMIIVSKSMEAETPATSGGSVALVGLAVRLAMSMSLHRDPDTLSDISAPEAEARRRVWTTLIFLDLSAAIDSGLPPVLKPADWDTAPPSSHGDIAPEGHGTSSSSISLVTMLTKAFPVVALVLSTVNQARPKIEYSLVMDCDRELRAVLQQAEDAFGRERYQSELLHHTMLQTFLRRTLLALHRSFAHGTYSTDEAHRTSHWSVLECSLALLRVQHTLYDERTTGSPQVWFADLFQSDFAVAMLFVVQGLWREDFSHPPPAAPSPWDRNVEQQQQPTSTAYLALRNSLHILRTDVRRSFHMFKIFLGVSLAVAALEASKAGSSIDQAMQTAAQAIIEAVENTGS